MNENQIYLLSCQLAIGHEAFWHGNQGWVKIGLIYERESNNEWPATILDGSTDHYIDLYNVDVDDLMIVIRVNVDWANPPEAQWANRRCVDPVLSGPEMLDFE